MRVKVIDIGNSRGIRLPKAILEQYAVADELELHLKPGHVVLRPVSRARAGWESAFKRMRARGHDRLLDAASAQRPSDWDKQEWTW